MNKPIGRTSDKKSPTDFDKFKNPSHLTLPNLDHSKKNFQKGKRDRCKQNPTKKWCDYHNSTWHDTSECKAWKTFLEKLLTSNLFNRTLVESDPNASTILDLTSTNLTASPIIDEEE